MTRRIVFSGFLMAGGRGLNFILLLVFAYYLPARDFGYFSLMVSVVTVGAVVAQFGGQNFFLKETPILKDEGDYDRIFKLVSIFFALSLIMSFLYIVIFGAVDKKDLFGEISPVVIFFSIVCLSFLLILVSVVRCLVDVYVAQTIEMIVRPALALAVFLMLMIFFGGGLDTAVNAYVSSLIFCLLLAFATFLFFLIKGRNDSDKSENGTKPFLIVAAPIYFLAIARLLTGELSPLVISGYLPVEDVGVFRFFMQLSLIVAFPLAVLNYYMAPKLSLLASKKKNEEIWRMMRLASVYGGAVALFVFAVSAFFLAANYGSYIPSHFSSSYQVYLVVGLSQVINVFFGPVGLLLVMSGHAWGSFFAVIVAGVVNIAIIVVCVPLFGLIAAALAMLISTILWNGIMYFLSIKMMGVRE